MTTVNHGEAMAISERVRRQTNRLIEVAKARGGIDVGENIVVNIFTEFALKLVTVTQS